MAIITYPLNNLSFSAEDVGIYNSTRSTGIFSGDDFTATMTGSDNNITVGAGMAWMRLSKFFGVAVAMKAQTAVDMGLPDTNYPRIDAVVLQFDANKNSTDLVVKKGTAASTPIPPTVTRTEAIHEIHLYQVRREPSATAVVAAKVTDLRLNASYCGLMADAVTKVDTTAINAQITELIRKLEEDLESVEDQTYYASKSYVDTETKDTLSSAKAYTDAEIKTVAPLANNAGSHNAIYRGKYLGTSITDTQWAAISAGTFDDLYIGDYWTIDGVSFQIAAFDYYYRAGDKACGTHHVTLVPTSNMYTAAMNTSDVVTGAYVGSDMYKTGLAQAKTTISSAFGAAHILSHRQYLQNATTNGYASGGSWYDSTVELMTEQNVYGCGFFRNAAHGTALPNSYTVDNSQFPLFRHRPDMRSNRQQYWLRDVGGERYFCVIDDTGICNYRSASNEHGVRPAFSIC